MGVEEAFIALCPGARVLDTAENASHLAKRRELADLAATYFSKLSSADPEEAAVYARLCAILFAKLLPHLREDDLGRYGVQALPSFVVLGIRRLSEEGTDAGACKSSVLRVLARLVRAADTEPALRAEVGSPALWCGVDLLTRTDGQRAAWEADYDSQADFFLAVWRGASLQCRPLAICPPEEASHEWCWYSCLCTAKATVALAPTTMARGAAGLPPIITAAFQAATEALAACSSASPSLEVERMFLLSAGRLHLLPKRLAAREQFLGAAPGELLSLVDVNPVMLCNVQLVQRLLREASETPAAGEGEASLARMLPAEDIAAAEASQSQLLVALRELLRNLQVFLLSGMQLGAFLVGQGMHTLLAVLLAGVAEDNKFSDASVDFKCRCLCLAAECLTTALVVHKEAPAAFASTGGRRQLLRVVHNLPLCRVAEAYVDNGNPGWWQVLCKCLSVLELAVCNSEQVREELVRAGGIEALLQATRWDRGRPGSCEAPADVRARAEGSARAGGLQDILRAVATHALFVVGEVWIRAGEGSDARRQLASLTCLGELEQFARLAPPHSASPEQPEDKKPVEHVRQPRREAGLVARNLGVEGIEAAHEQMAAAPGNSDENRADCLRDKYPTSLDLSLAVVICAQALLEKEGQQGELLLDAYPQLYGQVLSLAERATSDATVLPQSVAFRILAATMRGKATSQLQLLQDKVHLTAGMALTSALIHIKEQAQAAQTSRRGPARGTLPKGPVLHGVARYCTLIIYVTWLLDGLKQAGVAGQTAALELVTDGRLEEAAAGAALAFSSPHPSCENAGRYLKEFLSWAHELLPQNGMRLTAERAEAAAAALLAEEEAAQSKAAAKAAKRQRQKAAKQQAKQQAGQGNQPQAEASATASQQSKPWATESAGEPSCPMLPTAAAPTECIGHIARCKGDPCASEPDAAVEPVLLQEAVGNVAGHASGEPLAQLAEQPGCCQQAGRGTSASHSAISDTPYEKLEQQQQQRDTPARSLDGATNAASYGLQQAGRDSLPALPAVSGSSQEISPASTPTVCATTSPAVPTPATPAQQQSGTAALLLSPVAAPPPVEARSVAAAAPPRYLPVPASAQAIPLPAPKVLPAPAADEQEEEDQALLEMLLPGITLGKHSQKAEPPVGYPVPPAAAVTNSTAPLAGLGSSTAGAAHQERVMPPATLPAVLVCPLTGHRLTEPVIAADGYTYERQALAAWVQQGNSQSPVTGRPMPPDVVRPNFAVRELLLAP